MADAKISALTGATTPLAGTEVVPVVQSGSTKKVAISDLTAGRAVSAAQLDVDNIRVDGNTISSTNTNGNIALTPNGSGATVITNPQTVQSINAQVGTTYTLAAADAGKLVTLNNGSAITLTVPTNAVTPFAIGTTIDLAQLGAGQVTVSSSATLRSTPGAKLRAQFSGASLVKIATDEWLLVGDLTA
jgi:hypothetical protein